jgi:hypothetical protein
MPAAWPSATTRSRSVTTLAVPTLQIAQILAADA